MKSAPRSSRAAEVQFANLARVVRHWSDEEGSDSSPKVSQWLVLEESLPQSMSRSRSLSTYPSGKGIGWQDDGRSRRRMGVTVVAAFAVLALMLLRGFSRPEPKLTFVISGAAAVVGGPAILENGGDRHPAPAETRIQSTHAPAQVSFSDGSAVILETGARGSVLSTTERGARVRLEMGRARFSVTHLPHADWAVEAGPFVVIVHGTVFDVNWSPQSENLGVNLIAGTITVQGPMPGGQVTMKAGQRLAARLSTGQGQVSVTEVAAGNSGGMPPPEGPSQAALEHGLPTPSLEPPVILAPAPAPLAAKDDRRWRAKNGTSMRSATRSARAPSEAGTLSAAEVAEATASWGGQVASGAFQSVVAQADALGVDRCLKQAPVQSLAALADAARYVRRTELAQRALLAERRRFGGSKAAHDAAFLMGRLAEDASGDAREALIWYDRYLAEAEQGTYSAEALGRKMVALSRLRESADARIVAEQYLARYPDGPFATRAQRIRGAR